MNLNGKAKELLDLIDEQPKQETKIKRQHLRNLQKLAHKYKLEVMCHGEGDKDSEYEIFEGVIEMFYGPIFFKWQEKVKEVLR